MRTLSRVVATSLVAVLATLTVGAATGAADARSRRTGFAAPTSITYLGATCVRTGEYTWQITHNWEVRGGRYANLTNAQHTTYDDKVYRGGRRVIPFTTSLTGYTDLAEVAHEVTAVFSHIYAPIKKANDVMKWRSTEFEREVTLTCG